MTRQNILQRLLLSGAGLIILTAILFPVAIILYFILDKTGNATPESGIPWTIMIIIMHLLILYAFREATIVNKRDGHMSNVVYIASGTGLLLFGLLFLIMAVEFLGGHNYYLTTILIFFCFFCDILAAIISFTALFLQPKN